MWDSYDSHLGGGDKGQISEENLSWLSSHSHYISQRSFRSKRLTMLAAPPVPHSPLPDAWQGLLVSLVRCRADVRYVGAGESAKAMCDLTLTMEWGLRTLIKSGHKCLVMWWHVNGIDQSEFCWNIPVTETAVVLWLELSRILPQFLFQMIMLAH